ncbi:hypothetical protein LIER_05642 [Lithospermum erythrorhizon]|uniref:RNase H type-1 domain-containing protein n=1 Tax=Lithospermum erythrorhizon TaxID=34254 RepID=A0AAV3P671_LITER
MEYALRFSFMATNNEAEYEKMIAGIMLVKSLDVQRVIVRGDSKLVMDQINGECGLKNEILMKYHEKAVTMAKGFEQTIFQRVLRALNEEADRLSQSLQPIMMNCPKRCTSSCEINLGMKIRRFLVCRKNQKIGEHP